MEVMGYVRGSKTEPFTVLREAQPECGGHVLYDWYVRTPDGELRGPREKLGDVLTLID